MTRSIRGARRAAAMLTGTAAATTLLLSGCGTGQIAETAAKVPTSIGANAQSPDNNFKVRNLSIDYSRVEGYRAGENAPLNVALYNDSGQPVTVKITPEGARAVVLTGPSAPPTPGGTASASPSPATTSGSPEPGGSASATPSGGASASPSPTPAPEAAAEIRIPAGGFVVLNKAVGSWLQLAGLTEALLPGESVPLTFDFSGTKVLLDAPVAVPLTPAPTGAPVVGGNEEGHGG
ncbi:hypothetical protein I0C86_27605 [Plantactinospora sp. S1510]|uniref:Copper chaperone PCu(A)C n=1 Tax=Plantactinospora alkalitolerans TaxID=2789879 RepID=A0ABS0H2K9_9ACTN|nr:hypothetical protein [Plantactinospora alkalitolerans]MBF9132692.1 hypothetical protein [Plantactinospora alkalitolerans]